MKCLKIATSTSTTRKHFVPALLYIQSGWISFEWLSKSNQQNNSSEEWDFGFDFSYIHTRLTFGCFSDMRTQVIDQALRNLKPGGWLECQELDPVVACDDGTMPADYSPKQLTLALEAASRIAKRQFTCAPLIRGWLEEAGFVDVQQKVFKLPVNGWDASSPRASELGKMWFDNLSSGLGAVCTALLHRHANKQVEEIEVCILVFLFACCKGNVDSSPFPPEHTGRLTSFFSSCRYR